MLWNCLTSILARLERVLARKAKEREQRLAASATNRAARVATAELLHQALNQSEVGAALHYSTSQSEDTPTLQPTLPQPSNPAVIKLRTRLRRGIASA
jgi:hypothetical protein